MKSQTKAEKAYNKIYDKAIDVFKKASHKADRAYDKALC